MKKLIFIFCIYSFLNLYGHEIPSDFYLKEKIPKEEQELLDEFKEQTELVKKTKWTCPFCGKQFDKPTAHHCISAS